MKKQFLTYLLVAILPVCLLAQGNQPINNTDSKGLKQGRWIELNNSLESSGDYVNNMKNGMWITHFQDNNMLYKIENFEMDKKQGVFIELSKRGSLVSEQYFTNDMPDGPVRQYAPNGLLLSSGNYRQGVLHGIQTSYYENMQSKKSEESTFSNGVKDGPSRWFNTEGAVIAEYIYSNGMLQGEQKSFYNGEKVRTLETYLNNIQEGPSIEYFENGQIKINGQYKNGLKEGKWMEYDESGKLIKSVSYSKGNLR